MQGANPATETVAAYFTGLPYPNQLPTYKNYQDTYQPHANHYDQHMGVVVDSNGKRYNFWYCATDHKLTCVTLDGQSAPTFVFQKYAVWSLGRYQLTHLGPMAIDPKTVNGGVAVSASVSQAASGAGQSQPGTFDVWFDQVNAVLCFDNVT